MRHPLISCALVAVLALATAAQAQVVVDQYDAMRYLDNSSDPGIGLSWVQAAFDDSSWQQGTYGIGFETATGDSRADVLIETPVPSGTRSVYTRVEFQIDDVSAVQNLFLGADYDDGYEAWINGVQVFCSSQMPTCSPSWDSVPGSHESSNAPTPDVSPLQDISAAGIAALQNGTNVLAIGVWNRSGTSSDLVLAPRLIVNRPSVAVTRGPYLQQLTDSGVIIRWRTATATDSRVRFGPFPDELSQMVDDSAVTTEHSITLTGLSPNTEYCYSVGSTGEVLAGDDLQHFFWTGPPAGTRQPVRIWAIGDSGTANADAGEVRRAYERYDQIYTDLWLMLGDNAYDDGTDAEYQAAVFETYPRQLRTSAVWPTLGNHDSRNSFSDTLSGPYYDSFELPGAAQAGGIASGTEAYYSFDYANIHFISLNSDDVDRTPGSAMLTWLEQDLADTLQDWIIAFWHHPPYTKGSHDSDDVGDSSGRLFDMREYVLPLLDDWGVDLVLTGHSHSYERSFLLDGHYGISSTLTPAMVLDGGDGRLGGDGAYEKLSGGGAPYEGAVYVVAGSSGKLSSGTLDHPAMALSLQELGSMVLDVFGDRLDASFLRDDGTVRDVFTMVKNTATPPGADFEGSPLNGPAPLTVNFLDLSSTNTTGWSWDLDGDGLDDSTDRDPTFTYTQPGSYTVRLTASNQSGSGQEQKTAYVCVSGADPSRVPQLLFGDTSNFSWSATALATGYDVIKGDLDQLRSGNGDFSTAITDCLADNGSGTSAADPAAPGAGQAFFYLVRGVSCAGETGSYDSDGGQQSASRDTSIGGAPATCP